MNKTYNRYIEDTEGNAQSCCPECGQDSSYVKYLENKNIELEKKNKELKKEIQAFKDRSEETKADTNKALGMLEALKVVL